MATTTILRTLTDPTTTITVPGGPSFQRIEAQKTGLPAATLTSPTLPSNSNSNSKIDIHVPYPPLEHHDETSSQQTLQSRANQAAEVEASHEEVEEEDPEELDLSTYPPPEAVLTPLPDSTPETIRDIVESALENVTQQIRLEKQRAEEEARLRAEKEWNREREREADALRQAEAEAEARDAKGKGVSRASTENHPSTIPNIKATPIESGHGGGPTIKFPSGGRSRFGLRRMFHRKGESKGETSMAAASRDQSASSRAAQKDEEAPSVFTQFIYKHIHPKLGISTSDSGSDELTCVSCFEDLTPKEGVKTVCHTYCKDCFQMLIQTAIENQAQWPPKCCLNPVPYRTITKHVNRDLLRRYRDTYEEMSIPAENRIYCSSPDCGEWIRSVNRDRQTAVCKKGHAMCVMCRQPPHETDGGECPRDTGRQLVERLAEEEGWRRCIDCGILVEHREACQHMTCRCGAEFCYVCGARWRSCHCSMDELADIKRRAAERRAARQATEVSEDEWLQNALRLIEEYEREEERKAEEARAAAVARREERRRRRAAERARREEARLVELEAKYDGLLDVLVEIENTQRAVLLSAHEKDLRRCQSRNDGERNSLASQQDHERAQLRVSTVEQIRRCEEDLQREYRARLAWEKQLEADYRQALNAACDNKAGGEQVAREAMRAYMAKNDERMRMWCRWRDNELQRMRYAVEEELAVREELMETMRQRQGERLAARERELKRTHTAEDKWFELVVAERKRLLAELELVERENGGDNEEESVASGTDDDEIENNRLAEDDEGDGSAHLDAPGSWPLS